MDELKTTWRILMKREYCSFQIDEWYCAYPVPLRLSEVDYHMMSDDRSIKHICSPCNCPLQIIERE